MDEPTRRENTASARWERVRDILDRALRLPATEIAGFLDQTCAGDDSLRAEVHSLLSAARGPAILDRSEQAGLPTRVAHDPPPVAALAAGTTISHYRVLSRIGGGGMGVVYKAEDLNLGRVVALKIISLPDITEHDRERFAREAKAASALNHPNIVTIYEFNRAAGIDFIAMEYIEGTPLDLLLRDSGPLDEPRILDYARQTAAALSKAHAAGIVHRDLKPGNIMITPEGVVKVLDFGLARIERSDGEEISFALTHSGALIGTPAYMSPEQVMGETATAQSDVFSFGVILYEMISGVRPFHGRDTAATMRQILYKDAPPLEQAWAAESSMGTLTHWCLRKNREERPSSMRHVLEVLAGGDAPPAVPSQSAPALPPPVPASRAGRRLSFATAAILAILAIALGLANRDRILGSISRAIPLSRSSQDWYAAGQTLLYRYDRHGNLDKAADAFQSAIQADRRNAAAHASLAESHLMRILLRNTEQQWAKLALDASNRAVEINPYLALGHANRGYALLNLGKERLPDAVRSLDRALQLDPRSAPASLYRALAWERQNNPPQAEEFHKRAVSLAPLDWRMHQRLGAYFFRTSRMADAVAAFQQAAAIVKDSAMVYSNLGAALHASGRFEEAAAAYQRSLEAHPTGAVYSNLGTLWYFLGRYNEAAGAFEKALAIDASSYQRWGNFGDAARWAPDHTPKARQAYANAIRLAREQLQRSPGDADLHSSLATYLAKGGQPRLALAELEKVDFNAVKKPAVLYKAALVQELSGNRSMALEFLHRAVASGYTVLEIQNDPEFLALRRDPGYQRIAAQKAKQSKSDLTSAK